MEDEQLEAVADRLAETYIDTPESIFVKKYGVPNRGGWENLVGIMENGSIEGRYKKTYSGGEIRHFMFIALNIGHELMEEYLRPRNLEEGQILDVTFYTPLLDHVVEVIERVQRIHDVPKWRDFLEMWQNKRKEIINPQYRDECFEASIYQKPRPPCPYVRSTEPMDRNLDRLNNLIFRDTLWKPIFLVHFNPEDQYVFERVDEMEPSSGQENELVDSYTATMLKVSHFVLAMIRELYGDSEPQHYSLIAPGWPVDLLKDDWSKNPKYLPLQIRI